MKRETDIAREVRRTAKLFRGFRMRDPRSVTDVRVDLPTAVITMGPIRGIAYEMPRGRRHVLYWHEFAKGSEPTLTAGPDRCGIVVIGGNYRVTDRGIVDYTASGREAPHAKTLELVIRRPR